MIKNIETSIFQKKFEYKVRLLVSLFFVFYDSKPQLVANELGEKVLEIDKMHKFINGF